MDGGILQLDSLAMRTLLVALKIFDPFKMKFEGGIFSPPLRFPQNLDVQSEPFGLLLLTGESQCFVMLRRVC